MTSPIFAIYSLASKELVRVNCDESLGTNLVSALGVVRERLCLITEQLNNERQELGTITCENAAMDIIQINQCLVFQRGPLLLSRRLALFNYYIQVMQCSERFHAVLLLNPAADVQSVFQSASANQIVSSSALDTFVDVTAFSAQQSQALRTELIGQTVLAATFRGAQLIALAHPSVDLNKFGEDKAQLAMELNGLRLLKGCAKVCIPSVQNSALLFAKTVGETIFMSAQDEPQPEIQAPLFDIREPVDQAESFVIINNTAKQMRLYGFRADLEDALTKLRYDGKPQQDKRAVGRCFGLFIDDIVAVGVLREGASADGSLWRRLASVVESAQWPVLV